MRLLHWSTHGSRPTGRRPPPDADPPAPIRAFGRFGRQASDVWTPANSLAARSARLIFRIIAAWIDSAPVPPAGKSGGRAHHMPRCAEGAEQVDWEKVTFRPPGAADLVLESQHLNSFKLPTP